MQRLRLRRWAIGLAFLTSFCHFLSFAIDESWLSLVAGCRFIVIGCLMFDSTYRVVIEPREEDWEYESWGWRP